MFVTTSTFVRANFSRLKVASCHRLVTLKTYKKNFHDFMGVGKKSTKNIPQEFRVASYRPFFLHFVKSFGADFITIKIPKQRLKCN